MEEIDKMFHHVFGKPPAPEKVKKEKKSKEVNPVFLRRSVRLLEEKKELIISCPLCFQCFEDVSIVFNNHFKTHF